MTHTPVEVNEVAITPDTWLIQAYDTLHDSLTEQTRDKVKVSLENVPPADIPQLEENLMSLPEITPDKVMKLQESDDFCKNILQHINCCKHENYSQDATGILHKKVIDFNNVFSAVVVPQILIKYLLHTSHNLLGHVGATKLYHFLKWLYYFKHMKKKLQEYVMSCHKGQIMNLQKPRFIDLYHDISQTPPTRSPIYWSLWTIQGYLLG